MISEDIFNAIFQRAKTYMYSSMNYIDFDDCKNAEILYDCMDLILLRDRNKTPSMLYFAANNYESFVNIIAEISGGLCLHFIPREYVPLLERIGFIEWSEYTDFWNVNLTDTLTRFANINETEYLSKEECEEASAVSQKCRLQSRGFEGETKEWFEEWLTKNKVIILRRYSEIVGFCCVSIYNEGTTLWIREIAVDPACQGAGLGKKMMGQAIRYGVENGAVKGFLAADILNKNAIGLYEKYDFHAKNVEDSEIQMIKK